MNDQSPLTQLLQVYGQYLKPLATFGTTQDQTTSPLLAAYQNSVNGPNGYQANYERQTLNPTMQGIADTAATQYGNMMGNNPANMQRQFRAVDIPYQAQLENARNQYLGLGAQNYSDLYSQYLNSPTSFISGVTQ